MPLTSAVEVGVMVVVFPLLTGAVVLVTSVIVTPRRLGIVVCGTALVTVGVVSDFTFVLECRGWSVCVVRLGITVDHNRPPKNMGQCQDVHQFQACTGLVSSISHPLQFDFMNCIVQVFNRPKTQMFITAWCYTNCISNQFISRCTPLLLPISSKFKLFNQLIQCYRLIFPLR